MYQPASLLCALDAQVCKEPLPTFNLSVHAEEGGYGETNFYDKDLPLLI